MILDPSIAFGEGEWLEGKKFKVVKNKAKDKRDKGSSIILTL